MTHFMYSVKEHVIL